MQVSAPADGGAWEIVVLDGKPWTRGADVLLKHVESGAYLMAREDFDYNANNCGQQCPIAGHLEVQSVPEVALRLTVAFTHLHRLHRLRCEWQLPRAKPTAWPCLLCRSRLPFKSTSIAMRSSGTLPRASTGLEVLVALRLNAMCLEARWHDSIDARWERRDGDSVERC
jgi:hypothetical protein